MGGCRRQRPRSPAAEAVVAVHVRASRRQSSVAAYRCSVGMPTTCSQPQEHNICCISVLRACDVKREGCWGRLCSTAMGLWGGVYVCGVFARKTRRFERQRQQSVSGPASSLFPDTSNRDVGKLHKKKIDERVARIRYSSSAGQPGTNRHVITLANRCVCVCLVYAEHPIFRKSRQKRKTTNPQAFQRHGPVLQTLYTFVLMLWHQASTTVVIFQGSCACSGWRERESSLLSGGGEAFFETHLSLLHLELHGLRYHILLNLWGRRRRRRWR